MVKIAVCAMIALLLGACSPAEEPSATPLSDSDSPDTSSIEMSVTSPVDKHIVIAADPWCPHNCEAGSDHEGYMVDIAREALGLAGYTLEYRNYSWARALEMTRQGQLDGVVGAFHTDAPGFVFPEVPQGRAAIALYTHPDSDWNYDGIESLQAQTLLALNGYSYTRELDDYIESNLENRERIWIISGPSPLDRALNLLQRHRTDVFAEDVYVMAWAIRNNPELPRLRRAGQVAETESFVAFSPTLDNAPELAKALSDGTRTLQDNGRLEEILGTYGLTPDLTAR